MTIRICTAALLAMLTAPAYADAFPDSLPSDPARPGWRPPAARAYFPPSASHFDYDPESGALPLEDLQDSLWLSPFFAWGVGAGATPVQVSPGPVVTQKPCVAVPGPLPVLGLGAAFAYSRKLRQRIR